MTKILKLESKNLKINRERQLKENIFELWFELLKRYCNYGEDITRCLYYEHLVLENSKQVLKENFFKHYSLSEEVKIREGIHD